LGTDANRNGLPLSTKFHEDLHQLLD
jgi:hypothetical protein